MERKICAKCGINRTENSLTYTHLLWIREEWYPIEGLPDPFGKRGEKVPKLSRILQTPMPPKRIPFIPFDIEVIKRASRCCHRYVTSIFL